MLTDILYWQFLMTAVGIFLFGLDDLLIDLCYWFKALLRQWKRRELPELTLEKLNSVPEKKMALMIPCWQESEVVGEMIDNTVGTVAYENYEIFVGIYPNDPATRRALTSLSNRNPKIHAIVGHRPGPTTKADNLNMILEGIRKEEKYSGTHFEIFIMHDAEDVIHPMSFKLYNYLIPKKDMVQIPVFPLESKFIDFTHWTYADEFAENHTKDLISREWLGGFVPSAGVGTAFSRLAFDKLSETTGGRPFNTRTLTEDYSLSLLLRQHDLKSVFVQQTVKQLSRKRTSWRRLFKGHTLKKEWIATRSLFPTTYSAATRQKSRWILGIALQEWKQTGWSGDRGTRYSLARDRKAPFGHVLVMSAYSLLGYWLFYYAFLWLSGRSVIPPIPPIPRWLLGAVTVVMIHRLFERWVAVLRIYGWKPAFFSIPRTLYLNIINVHAFCRALWIFLNSAPPVAWSKTVNRFPTDDQLRPFRRRFGDLLLKSGIIKEKDLMEALFHQKEKPTIPLGEILVQLGKISDEDRVQYLAQLFHLNVAPAGILNQSSDLWNILSTELKNHFLSNRAVPVKINGSNWTIALDNPQPDKRKALQHLLPGVYIHFILASEKDISRALSVKSHRQQ